MNQQQLLNLLFLVIFLQCYCCNTAVVAAKLRPTRQVTSDGSTAAASSKDRPLRIVSILTPPFLMLSSENGSSTGNDRYVGYAKDLAEIISTRLGRDYVLSLSADGQYGSRNSTRYWNGMISELIREEQDLIIADLTIKTSRMEVVDFTLPFMTGHISMMVSKQYYRQTQKDQTRVKSIEQLGQRLVEDFEPPIDFGTLENSGTAEFFRYNSLPALKRLSEYFDAHPYLNAQSITEGVMRVRESAAAADKSEGYENKPYAFIMESWNNDYLAGRYPCDTKNLGPMLGEKLYGLAVQKNSSSLLNSLNMIIMSLRESGQLEELHRKWWAPDARCNV